MNTNCNLCDKPIRQLQGRSRKRCNSCNTRIRRYRCKIAAVAMLGGKCQKCGFDRDPMALQFHHPDPAVKEFNLSSCANKSWEAIIGEIKKCKLWCSNCHQSFHAKKDEKFIQEAIRYKGRMLA